MEGLQVAKDLPTKETFALLKSSSDKLIIAFTGFILFAAFHNLSYCCLHVHRLSLPLDSSLFYVSP